MLSLLHLIYLMSFADHFSTIAKRYAAYRPTYPPALVDALASRTTPGTAWDVGCGNGQLSVALADRFAHVIATDPSQAQIDAAPKHPRVTYACSRAEASGLADASVDLIVAAQAAHWFDWPKFVSEAERIAKPGALVALVSYGIVVVDGAAGDVVAHFYRNVVGKYWPPGREHVENGYRDLRMPWPAVDAPALEMTAAWTREELLGYVSTWSATVKLVETEGTAPVDALHAQLAAAWPGDERRTIRWPLTMRFARA
jgi:SAM-dependent methyltransferase